MEPRRHDVSLQMKYVEENQSYPTLGFLPLKIVHFLILLIYEEVYLNE